MRKAGYFISFLAVTASLILGIISQARPDWLYATTPKGWPARIEITYGLYQRCETDWISLGSGGYINRSCGPFPSRSICESPRENALNFNHEHASLPIINTFKKRIARWSGNEFCILWYTAGYVSQLGATFAVVGLVAILSAGLSRARRRSLWKVVSGLIALRTICQIIAMALIIHLWRTAAYEPFESAELSTSFYINLSSWILDLFITFGIVITGLAAEAGHPWAAGGRAYRPILDSST